MFFPPNCPGYSIMVCTGIPQGLAWVGVWAQRKPVLWSAPPLLRPPGAIPSRSPPEATVCSFRSQKPKGFLGDFLLPILETVVDPVGIWGFSFFNFSLRNTENDLDLHLIFLLNKKMERTWLPEAVRGRSGDLGLDSGRRRLPPSRGLRSQSSLCGLQNAE